VFSLEHRGLFVVYKEQYELPVRSAFQLR